MRRDTLTNLIALVVAVVSLAASGVLAMRLTASVGKHKLGYADRALEGDPPEVGLGIAMGAFRGLFINYLWIRANQLKEDGRFYEAVELARAITRLQPRYPHVWSFHAWNLAYNLSVATQTPEERWSWVSAGIRLLRDEGIPANPNDLLCHKELAWIFLHKVQGVMDDANQYYKLQHAGEWTVVLGPPPLPDPKSLDRDVAIQRYVDWLTPVENAPETLAALEAVEPSVKTLLARLRDELQLSPNKELLSWYEVQRALEKSSERAYVKKVMGPRRLAMTKIFEDATLAKAWEALIPYVRRRVLIDEYHMEPQRMVRYTKKFGPLDWRHPATHALYWASRGVENAITRVSADTRNDYDFVNTDRIAIQSLQELWRNGELYFDFYTFATRNDNRQRPFYTALPNVHFVESYRNTIEEFVARGGIVEDRKVRAFTLFSAGYENFMRDAIRFYFRRGQRDLADKYYKDLAGWAGQNLNDPERIEIFSKPLDEFIEWEMGDRFITPHIANDEVTASLQAAYLSGLLAGQLDIFRSNMQYARDVHRYFFTKQYRQTVVGGEVGRLEQMPKDFRLMSGAVFASLMQVLEPDDAETVYGRAPNDLRLFAYDLLSERFREPLDQLAQATVNDAEKARPFDTIFPPPDGLVDHRLWIREVMEQQGATQRNVEQQ